MKQKNRLVHAGLENKGRDGSPSSQALAGGCRAEESAIKSRAERGNRGNQGKSPLSMSGGQRGHRLSAKDHGLPSGVAASWGPSEP